MNLLIIITDAIDVAFKVLAILFVAMCLVPGIPNSLGIDVANSGVGVAVVLAVFGITRPSLYKWTMGARAERALMRHRKARAESKKRG